VGLCKFYTYADILGSIGYDDIVRIVSQSTGSGSACYAANNGRAFVAIPIAPENLHWILCYKFRVRKLCRYCIAFSGIEVWLVTNCSCRNGLNELSTKWWIEGLPLLDRRIIRISRILEQDMISADAIVIGSIWGIPVRSHTVLAKDKLEVTPIRILQAPNLRIAWWSIFVS